jgi:hypothetical protein
MADKSNKSIPTKNIQKALAESRKSKKSNPTEETTTATTTETTATDSGNTPTEAPKRTRLTDEQRAARDAENAKAKADKKAAREKEKAERKAAKEAEKANKVPHMAKVEKQAKNLPALAKNAQSVVTDILSRFDESGITGVIAHLSHALRVKATERALKVELEEGQLVRLVSADGGNGKWIGHLAHVLQAQRIRCYVQPVGTEKKVYLFSSNVQPLSEEEIKAVSSATQRPVAKTA